MTREFRIFPADQQKHTDDGLFIGPGGYGLSGTKRAAIESAQYYANRFRIPFKVRDVTAARAYTEVQPESAAPPAA